MKTYVNCELCGKKEVMEQIYEKDKLIIKPECGHIHSLEIPNSIVNIEDL